VPAFRSLCERAHFGHTGSLSLIGKTCKCTCFAERGSCAPIQEIHCLLSALGVVTDVIHIRIEASFRPDNGVQRR